MREVFIIKDTLTNKISYYHLLLFLILLPFERFYSELVLISFTIHTIIHLRKVQIRSVKKTVLLLVLIYLLTIAGTIYSTNKGQAFKEWEKQLALFLFPLLLAINPLNTDLYKERLLKVFGFTCVLTILFLYFDAVKVILYNNLPLSALFTTAFINHNFSAPVNLHATYFSMYVTLSLTAFFYFFFISGSKVLKVVYSICIGISLAGLVQLSSKAVFIAALIILIFVIPFFMLKGLTRNRFIVAACAFSFAAVLAITRIDTFRHRYITGLEEDLAQVSINKDVLEPRMARWGCAWQLIKISPMIDHGTGTEVSLLKAKYFDERFYNSYLNELNAHNQYLSFLIKTGIAGLMVYLIVLFAGFKNAWNYRDPFFCSFIVIISVVSFSENILDVNKGIFFFSFFFPLFMSANQFHGKAGQAIAQ